MILYIKNPIQKREKLMCLAPELYNKLLKMNSNKYDKLPPSKLTNAGPEYDPETLFLDDSCNSYEKRANITQECIVLLKDEEKRTDISTIPLSKGDDG